MGEEEEEQQTSSDTLKLSFPTGRVKKIVKFDKDITRINSEALFLVTGATELFVQFLAEKSADIAADKKRKIVKLDHIRLAVKRHQPTRDFLLDSLPPSDHPPADQTVKVKEKSTLPRNTRRIDSFFRKPQENVVVDDDYDDLRDGEGGIAEDVV